MLRFLVVAVVAVVVLGFCVACGFFLVADVDLDVDLVDWDCDCSDGSGR